MDQNFQNLFRARSSLWLIGLSQTFVKQSMMSGVWNFAKKLRFEGGGVNHQVWFTLKSPNMIYPPPNHQVQFTLKSPSLIYPQIICTIYPPNCQVWFTFKSSVRFTPLQITMSDLPSNHQITLKLSVRFTPPPKIDKSDLPWNSLTCNTVTRERPFYREVNNLVYTARGRDIDRTQENGSGRKQWVPLGN